MANINATLGDLQSTLQTVDTALDGFSGDAGTVGESLGASLAELETLVNQQEAAEALFMEGNGKKSKGKGKGKGKGKKHKQSKEVNELVRSFIDSEAREARASEEESEESSDEFEEESKRKQYLDEQNDDLEKALETLESAPEGTPKRFRKPLGKHLPGLFLGSDFFVFTSRAIASWTVTNVAPLSTSLVLLGMTVFMYSAILNFAFASDSGSSF